MALTVDGPRISESKGSAVDTLKLPTLARDWLRTILVYLFLFTILLGMSLPKGMNTELSLHKDSQDCTPYLKEVLFSCRAESALTPRSTVDDVIAVYQLNDHASYAKAAKTGYKTVAAYWPPGIIVLEGIFYSISHTFPLGLGLVGVACLLWAGVLTAIWRFCFRRSGSPILSLLPAFLLMMCLDIKTYLGAGVFLAETYAISAFLLAIGLLMNVLDGSYSKFIGAAGAGIFLALAAYFRAQFDQIIVVATGLVILVMFFRMASRRLSALKRFQLKGTVVAALQAIGVAIIAYHAFTLPYRLTHYIGWIDGSNGMVWRLTWEKPEWFKADMSFFTKGGGAAGCVVDPERCQFIHNQLKEKGPGALVNALYTEPRVMTNPELQRHTVKSFIRHPIAWISFKAPYIINGFVETGKAGVYVAFLLIVIVGAVITRTPGMLMLAFFVVCAAITVIGPLFLIHLEPRYLDPITTLLPYAAILALVGQFKKVLGQSRAADVSF